MLIVHVKVTVRPGAYDEFVAHTNTLIAESRREPGVIEYCVGHDITTPGIFWFYETFEDQDAFDAHSDTDYFREWITSTMGLLAGAPEVTVLTALQIDQA